MAAAGGALRWVVCGARRRESLRSCADSRSPAMALQHGQLEDSGVSSRRIGLRNHRFAASCNAREWGLGCISVCRGRKTEKPACGSPPICPERPAGQRSVAGVLVLWPPRRQSASWLGRGLRLRAENRDRSAAGSALPQKPAVRLRTRSRDSHGKPSPAFRKASVVRECRSRQRADAPW